MIRRFSVCSCLVGLVAGCMLLALPLPAAAGTCVRSTYTVTTSQYTGPIDLGCETGDIKVKIIINYNFGPDCYGTVTFYRCGASSTPHNFACNVNRSFNVNVAGTWADGLAECWDVTVTEQGNN
jgi:hypothetical protein